jgi:hypothetical protein
MNKTSHGRPNLETKAVELAGTAPYSASEDLSADPRPSASANMADRK